MLVWLGWLRRRAERRAAERQDLVREAEALLAAGSRGAAMHELDTRFWAAQGDVAALRRIEALRAAVDALAPRPPRTDTATRMLYR